MRVSKGQGSKLQCPESIPMGKDGLWIEVLRIDIEAEELTTFRFTQYTTMERINFCN